MQRRLDPLSSRTIIIIARALARSERRKGERREREKHERNSTSSSIERAQQIDRVLESSTCHHLIAYLLNRIASTRRRQHTATMIRLESYSSIDDMMSIERVASSQMDVYAKAMIEYCRKTKIDDAIANGLTHMRYALRRTMMPSDYCYLPESSLLRASVDYVRKKQHTDDDDESKLHLVLNAMVIDNARTSDGRRHLPPIDCYRLLIDDALSHRASLLGIRLQLAIQQHDAQSITALFDDDTLSTSLVVDKLSTVSKNDWWNAKAGWRGSERVVNIACSKFSPVKYSHYYYPVAYYYICCLYICMDLDINVRKLSCMLVRRVGRLDWQPSGCQFWSISHWRRTDERICLFLDPVGADGVDGSEVWSCSCPSVVYESRHARLLSLLMCVSWEGGGRCVCRSFLSVHAYEPFGACAQREERTATDTLRLLGSTLRLPNARYIGTVLFLIE